MIYDSGSNDDPSSPASFPLSSIPCLLLSPSDRSFVISSNSVIATGGTAGDVPEPQLGEVSALIPALAGALGRYLSTPAAKIYDDVTEALLRVSPSPHSRIYPRHTSASHLCFSPCHGRVAPDASYFTSSSSLNLLEGTIKGQCQYILHFCISLFVQLIVWKRSEHSNLPYRRP